MSRLSRIALLSALVGVAAASQALFYNSGVQIHPHLPKIPYGQLDTKFQVRKTAGDSQFDWRNPFVVTPFPVGWGAGSAPWSGDNTHAANAAGRSTTSRWLSPFAVGTQASSDLDRTAAGVYEYRYQFNLSQALIDQLGPGAQIVGRWSSDNDSTAHFTNSLGTQTWTHSGGSEFTRWRTFTLSNFNPGLNELTFRVTNLQLATGNNPTGLRVEFTSVPAGVPVVPEPFTMALGAGALALAVARRRKAKK